MEIPGHLAVKQAFTTLMLVIAAWSTPLCQAAARPPNIVFILADDLGQRDLGCYGSTFYETPHLDKLAAQGARFTTAYAACHVCSPTRASILTGKYPARLHLTNFLGGNRRGKLLPADYIDHLPLEEVTIAEAMKEAGYATGFMGKWHLGGKGFLPQDQGFDVSVLNAPNDSDKQADGLTDAALRFIAENKDKPFFVHLCHHTPHIPLEAKPALVEKYRAKADALPPFAGPRFLPEGDTETRQVQDLPVYASMVQSLDDSVGRILRQLDDLGIADNTIVIFFSDNGGLSSSLEGAPTSNVPFRAGKGWLYEGGLREPLIIKWPGVVRAGRVCATPVISTDFYPTMLEMARLAPRPQQHCDGVSLVSLLKGGRAPDRPALFWHYPHYSNQGGRPGCAVRAGDYKLIRFFEDNHVELYNLKDDIGEKRNVAEKMPAKVKELSAVLDRFLKDTQAAFPKPNPDSSPAANLPEANSDLAGLVNFDTKYRMSPQPD